MDQTHLHETSRRTWIWLGIMLAIILGKGIFAFYMVSDRGQPTWSFRPVDDVPASSPYAVYQLLPNAQHVRGRGGD